MYNSGPSRLLYAYRQGKFSVKSLEKSNYIMGQLSNKRRQLKYNFKKLQN